MRKAVEIPALQKQSNRPAVPAGLEKQTRVRAPL